MYERCPREFALDYLTDAEDPRLPTPQLVLGNTVHAALAGYMRAPTSERSEELAHTLLRHYWSCAPRAQAFIHDEEEAAWGRQALALLSRFVAGPDATATPFALEEWVRAQLPNGRRVCGRVDRVDRAAEGLVVIDYKTGRRPEDFVLKDEVAARLYALAAFRTFHQPVAAVRFRWLGAGIEDCWYPDSEDTAPLEDELAELTERLCSDRVMLPQSGPWCRRCPFRDRCPAQRETPVAIAVPPLPF